HRPVQVLNFVTRGSIEERVLETVRVKQSLFDGVFCGTTDAVSFAALERKPFLDVVRELVGEEAPRPAVPAVAPAAESDPRQALVQLGVQFLETLAGMLSGATEVPADVN